MTTLSGLDSSAVQFAVRPGQLIPPNATEIQLVLAAGEIRQLSRALLGRSFIFGLLEDNLSWSLIRLSSILSLRFLIDDCADTQGVQWTRKTAGELVNSFNLPAVAKVQFRDQPKLVENFVLHAVARGIVVTDSHQHPYIPLAAISQLEVSNG